MTQRVSHLHLEPPTIRESTCHVNIELAESLHKEYGHHSGPTCVGLITSCKLHKDPRAEDKNFPSKASLPIKTRRRSRERGKRKIFFLSPAMSSHQHCHDKKIMKHKAGHLLLKLPTHFITHSFFPEKSTQTLQVASHVIHVVPLL
jgi:hypothetical protein